MIHLPNRDEYYFRNQLVLDLSKMCIRDRLKPQAEVGTDVKSLCGNGYNVSAWVDAVVPGIAFNSYVIAGLENCLLYTSRRN